MLLCDLEKLLQIERDFFYNDRMGFSLFKSTVHRLFLVESPSFECAEVELALRIARGQDRRGILVQQRRGPISTPSGKAT